MLKGTERQGLEMVILGKHYREKDQRQIKIIKPTDRNMKVGGQRQTVFHSDRHNQSVSQTSEGKGRFKASVVDTSVVSPRTVSL